MADQPDFTQSQGQVAASALLLNQQIPFTAGNPVSIPVDPSQWQQIAVATGGVPTPALLQWFWLDPTNAITLARGQVVMSLANHGFAFNLQVLSSNLELMLSATNNAPPITVFIGASSVPQVGPVEAYQPLIDVSFAGIWVASVAQTLATINTNGKPTFIDVAVPAADTGTLGYAYVNASNVRVTHTLVDTGAFHTSPSGSLRYQGTVIFPVGQVDLIWTPQTTANYTVTVDGAASQAA